MTVDHYSPGDAVFIDSAKGILKVAEREFSFPALPPEIQSILNSGGLLNRIKENNV